MGETKIAPLPVDTVETGRTRYRELRSLGLKHANAIEIANTRKGAWRTTKTPHIHKALGIAYWQRQGLKSLVQRYLEIRQAW